MKAVLLTGYGDVDMLELGVAPEPNPGPGQVKVRVVAAGINPVDWKLRRGDLRSLMPLELPAILGRDVAGEVVEVGPGVESLAVGDQVFGLVQRGYAETVVANVEAFARKPPELEATEAAALPLVGLTGAQLMEEAVDVKSGDVVLVTGAVGGVGRVAVFAAKRRGAKVIAGVRASQVADARALDPDGIVALDDPKEVADLPALDAIADTVNGEVIAKVLGKLKEGGVLGTVVGEPKGARERKIVVHTMLTHPDARRLGELGESLAHGDLELRVDERYPLSEVRKAQKRAEEPGVGKVLLIL